MARPSEIGGVAIAFATTPFGVAAHSACRSPAKSALGAPQRATVIEWIRRTTAFASALYRAPCRGDTCALARHTLVGPRSPGNTDMIQGSCHCGAVQWRFEGMPKIGHGVQLHPMSPLRRAVGL